MLPLVGKRLIQALVSLIGVTVLVFGLSHATGDPTDLLVSIDASEEEREAFRERFGLDEPLHAQYVDFLGDVASGDLGESIRHRIPAIQLIGDRLPNSLLLAAVAMAFATAMGVTVGVLAARRPGTLIDRLASGMALLGQSVPTFWVGIMLVLLFAITWPIFPSSNFDGPISIVLPAFTLGWFSTATMARISRSSMQEALSSQYVTVARSKGLSERRVVLGHALRSAIVSIITMGAMQFLLLVNGAIITEKIFNWPGVGSLLVDSAFSRDFPLVQAIVLVAAGLVIIVNLLTDIAYAFLDPRIRVQ